MISEAKIRKAATELNSIVSPPCDTEGDIESIRLWIEKVRGAGPPVIEPTDVFTEETTEVLNYFQTPEGETEPLPEEFEELTEDSLINQLRNAKKLRELKDLVNVEEELKSLRGTLGKYHDLETLRDKTIEVLTAVKAEAPVTEEEPVKIVIKQSFKEACPQLSEQEYADLEKLILKDKKVLQPLLLWNGFLVDGHNRYSIALRHNIPFTTKEMLFKDEKDVIMWIKENAVSQRNLTDFAKYELIKDIEGVLKEEARQRQSLAGKGIKSEDRKSVREAMAEKIKVSPSQMRKLKEFDEKAPEEVKEKVRKGKVKLGTALKEITKTEPKPEQSDKDRVEEACRILDKWAVKYQEDELFTDSAKQVIEITINLRAKFN